MTYKSFFSFELCKPRGTMMPRLSPTAGLSFAKLRGGDVWWNKSKPTPFLPSGWLFHCKLNRSWFLCLVCLFKWTFEGLSAAGRAPGAVHTCELAPAGEASHGKSLLQGRCPPRPSSVATATAAFNFQMRPAAWAHTHTRLPVRWFHTTRPPAAAHPAPGPTGGKRPRRLLGEGAKGGGGETSRA